MNSRQRKTKESLSVTALPAKMENEGGGNNVPDEILTAYNTYLHSRCLQKIQENELGKLKCVIKKKELQLKKQEAHLEALRRRKIEIQYLAETSNMLVRLGKNLESVSISDPYPAYILDDLPKIRTDLLHNGNQLPVKGATVDPDEGEKIMQILPHVKQTLEKLQDSLDDKDEAHKEVSDTCTSLVKYVSEIMEMQKRYDNMVDEIASLGLKVSSLNILKTRHTASTK